MHPHVAIARPDHWFKHVFAIPGAVVALSTVPVPQAAPLAWRLVLATLALCLLSSSYYTLNELLDAPFDLEHPTKRHRPVPSGQVILPLAWAQFVVLFLVAVGLATQVGRDFALTLVVLWLFACAYNVPPLRTKDRVYLDVLSEAVNNPLRMVAGWFAVTSVTLPPASLLLAYWMIGGYFMTLKRYAEFREISDPERAARYRRSFRWYTEERLLVAVMFYAASAMLFFGAFAMRYRLELLLAFPLVALVMAQYLRVALQPNSLAQQPERLHRDRRLMGAVVTCAMLMGALLFVELPALYDLLTPTAPPQANVPTLPR
jgi:decaprenyl-phosphate phosphoribosyltransferase